MVLQPCPPSSCHHHTASVVSHHVTNTTNNKHTISYPTPQSQRLVSIAPSASTQITFDIRITSDQVAQYGCIATITDTRAAVLDRRLVTFSVTATAYDPKPLDLVGAVPGSGGPNSSTSNPFYDPFLATADGGGGDGFTARPIDASNDKVQEVLRRRVDGSSAARGGVGGNGTVGNGTGGSNTTTVNACAAECKGLGDVGCNMVHRCTGPLVLYGMLVVALGILVGRCCVSVWYVYALCMHSLIVKHFSQLVCLYCCL